MGSAVVFDVVAIVDADTIIIIVVVVVFFFVVAVLSFIVINDGNRRKNDLVIEFVFVLFDDRLVMRDDCMWLEDTVRYTVAPVLIEHLLDPLLDVELDEVLPRYHSDDAIAHVDDHQVAKAERSEDPVGAQQRKVLVHLWRRNVDKGILQDEES